jgi:hypothetical protein
MPAGYVPDGWLWFFRMLPLSHVTDFVTATQFKGVDHLIKVHGDTTYFVPASAYISDYMSVSYDGYWRSFGYLILFIVVVQGMSFFATKYLVTAKR